MVFFALVLLLAFALRLHAAQHLRTGTFGLRSDGAEAEGRELSLLARVEALLAAADLERSAHGVAASELGALHSALDRGVEKIAARRRERGAHAMSVDAAPLVTTTAADPRVPTTSSAAVAVDVTTAACTGLFVVAYCQDRVEWIVKRWGPLLFPGTCTRLVNWDASDVATRDSVDVRICYRHNTAVIRDMMGRRGGRQITVTEEMQQPNGSPLAGNHGEWTSDARGLYWPRRLLRVVEKGGDGRTPMKPFIVSWNDEPWFKGTEGADLQVEGKRCDPNDAKWFGSFNANCPTYKPLMPWTIMVYGFAEWQPGHLATYEQVLVRPAGFDARAALAKKSLFCAFQHYNCGSHSVSSVMRNAFFDYLSAKYKAVSATGPCKASLDSAVISELAAVGATKKVRTARGNEDYTQKFEHFKFVLTWENAFLPGYVSERPMTAYIAHSVPIFWGAPDVVPDFIDARAVIVCDAPAVTERELKELQGQVKASLPEGKRDRHAVRDALEKRMVAVYAVEVRATTPPSVRRAPAPRLDARVRILPRPPHLFSCVCWSHRVVPHRPQFDACVAKVAAVDRDDAKWAEMVSSPFVPDGVYKGGQWDIDRYADYVREAYLRHGYAEP